MRHWHALSENSQFGKFEFGCEFPSFFVFLCSQITPFDTMEYNYDDWNMHYDPSVSASESEESLATSNLNMSQSKEVTDSEQNLNLKPGTVSELPSGTSSILFFLIIQVSIYDIDGEMFSSFEI
jgi:hypothetical protein